MKRFLIQFILFAFCLIQPCCAQESQQTGEEPKFIPYQQIKNIVPYKRHVKSDIKKAQSTTNSMKDFMVAHERFAQSNVVAAYNKYEKLTRNADNDFMRIILAYELAEKGYSDYIKYFE